MLTLFSERGRTRAARLVLIIWAFLTVIALFGNTRAWADDPKGDPAGKATGQASDVQDMGGNTFVPPSPADTDDAATKASKQRALDDYNKQAKSEPLAVNLANGVGQAQVAVNFVWTLVTGFLVMFMQAGFAMVETGFCRAKNASHVIMTNFMIYPIGALGFWIAGFSIMFGSVAASKIGGPASLGGLPTLNGPEWPASFGIVSWNSFCLSGKMYDAGVFCMFLFQTVFMDTTATIPTGAMAERWRFKAFMIYGLFVSIIAYPVYGHMMWGGGGLSSLGVAHGIGHGAVDFAGSSVVHAVGGFVGLAGAMVLGPRLGKYNKDGTPNTLAAHHIPMAIIGAFILAFGWFGFNPGSTLAAAGAGNLRISVIAVNTMIASATGAAAALLYIKMRTDKYDPGMGANGMLAGLVAITAPCAFVNSVGAAAIGAIAGVLVVISCFFWERHGVDDPVGAVSVHGVCGIWGLLSVGIFADGTWGQGFQGVGADTYNGVKGLGVTGLLYGDHQQIIAQVIAAVVCMGWSFGSAYIFFKVQAMLMKIRPTPEEELSGLDAAEMGVSAYPEFLAPAAVVTMSTSAKDPDPVLT